MGPHGNWYRLCCAKGGVETVRDNQNKVRLAYDHWNLPAGANLDTVYEPQWKSHAHLANSAGHGGGDFWVAFEFIQCLKEKKQHFLDVYRATAMSAVSIFRWRSVLNNSCQFDIPDFSDEKVRKLHENDHLTPFPTKDGKPGSIPYTTVMPPKYE
jgi:hypothetical protein